MERLLIEGGHRLEGTVQICGAKNASLPLIAASLLSGAPLTLTNLPDVADIKSMLTLMEHYGVAIGHRTAHSVTLDAGPARNIEAPYDIVRQDAGDDPRARPAAGSLRPCPRVDARRLRHRREAGRPAHQGSRHPGRRPSSLDAGTIDATRAERPHRRAHRVRLVLRRRDRRRR